MYDVLTRVRADDFVELYLLLREDSEHDLVDLLERLRARDGVSAHPFGLAARFLLVHQIGALPESPVTRDELVTFFEARARELVGPR